MPLVYSLPMQDQELAEAIYSQAMSLKCPVVGIPAFTAGLLRKWCHDRWEPEKTARLLRVGIFAYLDNGPVLVISRNFDKQDALYKAASLVGPYEPVVMPELQKYRAAVESKKAEG